MIVDVDFDDVMASATNNLFATICTACLTEVFFGFVRGLKACEYSLREVFVLSAVARAFLHRRECFRL